MDLLGIVCRFSDAHTQIRILCTSFSKVLLVNHPHLKEDVACEFIVLLTGCRV